MLRAMPRHEPLSDGQGAIAPPAERSRSAGAKRERDDEAVALEIATRYDIHKASAGSLLVASRPLVAVENARPRDRDLGVHSAAANGATTRFAHIRVRAAHADARKDTDSTLRIRSLKRGFRCFPLRHACVPSTQHHVAPPQAWSSCVLTPKNLERPDLHACEQVWTRTSVQG
jgi:hypothetical protein